MTPGGMLTAASRLIGAAVREKRDKLREAWASLRRPPREHTSEAERVEKARAEFQAQWRKRYEANLREWDERLRPETEAIERSERLTADDLNKRVD